MWNAFYNYHSQIDENFIKMLWRLPSRPPDYSSLEEADIALHKTRGAGWHTHIGNLANGIIGIMRPDKGDNGLYQACVGAVGRRVEPLTTDWHHYPIAPMRTFFELKLASTPLDVAIAAQKRSQYKLYYANKELRKLNYGEVAYAPLDQIINRAAIESQVGDII